MSGSVINGSRQIRILTAGGAPSAELASVRIRYRQATRLSAMREESPVLSLSVQSPLPEAAADDESAEDCRTPRTIAPTSSISAQADFIAATESPPSGETGDHSTTTVLGRIARALCRQQRSGFIIEHLANRVAEFCNAPSITSSGPWEIKLPIDPNVLPDTSLWLRLAARQLNLRFDSTDALSRQLLRDNKNSLAEKLANALLEKYDADIEVW